MPDKNSQAAQGEATPKSTPPKPKVPELEFNRFGVPVNESAIVKARKALNDWLKAYGNEPSIKASSLSSHACMHGHHHGGSPCPAADAAGLMPDAVRAASESPKAIR